MKKTFMLTIVFLSALSLLQCQYAKKVIDDLDLNKVSSSSSEIRKSSSSETQKSSSSETQKSSSSKTQEDSNSENKRTRKEAK